MTDRNSPNMPDSLPPGLRVLLAEGRHAEARRAVEGLLAKTPGDPVLLPLLASLCDLLGDFAASRSALERYIAPGTADQLALEALGQCCLKLGDRDAAIAAFARALAVVPGNPRLLLELGATLAEAGRFDGAAAVASLLRRRDPRSLELGGKPDATPMFRAASARLARILGESDIRLREAALAATRVRAGSDDDRGALAARAIWRPSLSDMGQDPRRPGKLFLPDVPPLPFRDPSTIPGLAALEARAEAIRAELLSLEDNGAGYRPYIAAHLASVPDIGALAGGMGWTALHLYNGGVADDALIGRLPLLGEALAGLPLSTINGRPVEVFFSALAPGVRIPPHHGISNHRLTVHLPLIVPDGCGVRVGSESRPVAAGRLLVFDDSFEHEAWNGSPHPRITLIFEIWAPELGPCDRAAVSALLAAQAIYESRAADILAAINDPESVR